MTLNLSKRYKMGIFTEIKSTYNFAKGELVGDLKRNPTTARALKKTKKFIKTRPKILKNSSVKRGKSISTEQALSQLKKDSPKSIYKKKKFSKKPIKMVRSEAWSTDIRRY